MTARRSFNRKHLKDEIRIDSEMAISESNKPFEGNRCIMYFRNSIEGAIQEYLKLDKPDNSNAV